MSATKGEDVVSHGGLLVMLMAQPDCVLTATDAVPAVATSASVGDGLSVYEHAVDATMNERIGLLSSPYCVELRDLTRQK